MYIWECFMITSKTKINFFEIFSSALWVRCFEVSLHLKIFKKMLILAFDANSALSCQNGLFPRFSSNMCHPLQGTVYQFLYSSEQSNISYNKNYIRGGWQELAKLSNFLTLFFGLPKMVILNEMLKTSKFFKNVSISCFD